MADQLSSSVALGLKLSRRVYYGKQSAPKASMMERSSESWLPKAPMVYAEILKPAIVDNPDIASYQPHVYGVCEPPALIPLHMHGIEMEVDCYLDTAFVTVSGTWRVHCVIANKTCDCRIAIPMGEQGSVLGVEVSTTRRSFYTQLITAGELYDLENMDNSKDGCLLKCQIYTLKVSQVDGGSSLHVKVRWSQKLVYEDGQFCLCIPFSFPTYVIPVESSIIKGEKILVNLKAGIGTQVQCKTTSHPLKELQGGDGESVFSYEAEVISFSNCDFFFSYSVCSGDISGGLLLQAPSLHDVDQREMFCFTLLSGSDGGRKVSRKVIIFVVDTSASMHGVPIESVKTALLEAISNLDPMDSFNIIAFNESTALFSQSMERATHEIIEKAVEWISTNLIPKGGTNIMLPLNQVDALTTQRGKEGGWVVERLVNQLLIELDGADQRRGVYVIGATNRPEVMDRAVLRPGRLGKLLYVPLPSPDERGLILKALAKKKLIDATVDLVAFGENDSCNFLSGADLAALMDEVAMAAIEDKLQEPKSSDDTRYTIKTKHFDQALKKIPPSVSIKQNDYYVRLQQSLNPARQLAASDLTSSV